jgi:hypothetical protein
MPRQMQNPGYKYSHIVQGLRIDTIDPPFSETCYPISVPFQNSILPALPRSFFAIFCFQLPKMTMLSSNERMNHYYFNTPLHQKKL